MATLGKNRYGKQKVRVLRKHIDDERQSVVEISADVLLEGAFEKSYLSDDNTQIVATDTVKNTIIALAHDHLGPCIENFALVLKKHFLDTHKQVERLDIELREKRWDRLTVKGAPAPHSFIASPIGEPFTRLAASRSGQELVSGIRGLTVLNSTNSAFENFDHTQFTTLKDASDRILSTIVEAEWNFPDGDMDYRSANERILETLLEVFALRFSPSVQRTLFEMGEEALARVREITGIRIALPNRHYFTADLSPFEIDNANLTFIPQSEPHGQIEATVLR